MHVIWSLAIIILGLFDLFIMWPQSGGPAGRGTIAMNTATGPQSANPASGGAMAANAATAPQSANLASGAAMAANAATVTEPADPVGRSSIAAEQPATRSPVVTRPSPEPEIGEQLTELTKTINKLGSRLENLDAAINRGPSSFVSAQAEFTDPPEDPTEEGICKKLPSYTAVGNWAVAEGDIIIGSIDQFGRFAPIIRPDSTSKWPNGEIPYIIDASLDPSLTELPQRKWIIEAIIAWENATGVVHFRPATKQDKQDKHYINFTRKQKREGVCLSHIGRRKEGPQQLLLEEECNEKNIRHEIGHALGLFHEQTRDDRNNYVKINWSNIDNQKYPGAESQFCRIRYNPYLKYPAGVDIDVNVGNNYDLRSVMQYRLDAFAKPTCKLSQGCMVIEPKPETLARSGITDLMDIGRFKEISDQDIEAIRQIYGRPSPPPPHRHPHPKIVWCCCCWRYRPIDCQRPQAWRHEYWRPHRMSFSRYFDEWYE